jgi:putative chitinase
MKLTKKQIEHLLHGNAQWEDWVKPIQTMLPKYGIDTADRIAMFFAQCGHESLNFKVLKENLNYSAKGLNAVFPKYFKRAGRDAQMYHRNPERIANVVYANRMGNGDTDSGEGWLYRGRGVIQLTGKNNYEAFAASVKMKLDKVVDYLGTKEGALESACWYWDTNGLNALADAQDIRGATKRINGGYNGLEDRQHHYHKALKVLGGEYSPEPAPTLIKVGSRGSAVVAIQQVLGLNADGIFGEMTKKAVMAWQAKKGLTADGIVGPKTYAKMMS